MCFHVQDAHTGGGFSILDRLRLDGPPLYAKRANTLASTHTETTEENIKTHHLSPVSGPSPTYGNRTPRPPTLRMKFTSERLSAEPCPPVMFAARRLMQDRGERAEPSRAGRKSVCKAGLTSGGGGGGGGVTGI